VIDPAFSPELVLARAAEHSLQVLYLINTHGHFDHAGGNDIVLSKTKAKLLAGGSGSVADGQQIVMGKVALTFIQTPGHSADSICVLANEPEHAERPGKLVTGDTLFVGKVGGTGFGEDARAEYESLNQKLMVLPDETEVWPGHDVGVSPSSTIGNERQTNPFILQKSFEDFVHLKRTWLEYNRSYGIA
jgi:glyoxylase-like metal-dependent hydrolase (beta-lactamase superfamily II)